MSRVGERIKEARLKGGISQKVLAKKLGVAEKYINDIELGRKVAQESLIDRASKVLNVDLNDVSMVVTDEILMEEKKSEAKRPVSKGKKEEVSEIWNDAFGSVLKKVPVVNYDLVSLNCFKELPIHSNKIEGYPQDKVMYIKIQDDEMLGFRINKNDLAFAHQVKEIVNNGIYLIEYNGDKKVRQIKDLGNSKLLLVSNRNTVMTETIDKKSINVIAKLEKIEFLL